MSDKELSQEQLDFLEECNNEFADRYTEEDPEYKMIYDLGIPTPPIICPWYARNRFNRDRAGGSRFHRDRDNRRGRDFNEDRGRDRNDHYRRENRFRPYH
ncbi:RNA guanine-N7 methyltransferase activating subunit [Aethina tumida]|uniref:RNA guanine-N7 methyltransferase activating subunit n=1 Tax=Aethina tumida TaxID=116153 RepID=UPI00096B61E0|nr:RNA guanine-N7 methyltransferase activating subunit [Aethina tumida]